MDWGALILNLIVVAVPVYVHYLAGKAHRGAVETFLLQILQSKGLTPAVPAPNVPAAPPPNAGG